MLILLKTQKTTLKEWFFTLKTKIINHKKYKNSNTILKSFDTLVIIAWISSSSTLSLTGIGLVVIQISAATTSGLSKDKKKNLRDSYAKV